LVALFLKRRYLQMLIKWEELIAEARAAGFLAFCADGIAVLKQVPTHGAKEEVPGSESDQRLSGSDREKGRESGDRESQSAQQ
jgi:hypothetical protein